VSKTYRVEIKLGKTWILKQLFSRHTDALHFLKECVGERYPMRIVCVIKTIIFREGK
jgi:hypothetical protein